ncbi:MAG: DUF5056 domain-containing protein [Bacteroidales bacterium]|nr:DUF5056 domain-containing protein [Bacteroidales bacterium]
MKDNNIKEFLDQHKQKIEDNGFSDRLFATLDCLPKPLPAHKETFVKSQGISINSIITLTFSLIGVALFFVFGGYIAIIESLVSLGGVIEGTVLITPQFIISILFLISSLFVLGRFAIEIE